MNDSEQEHFENTDVATEQQTENAAIQAANEMNLTFKDMEMRDTRITVKVGEGNLDDQEEDEELLRFQDMSLPQKRLYISKMEKIRKGFMTPGMMVDDMIDKRIQDLD